MCQMSMKLPAVFDQNLPHTFDKNSEKTHNYKKTLSKLDLDPKCQFHSRNQQPMIWETKNMPPKKHLSRGCLSNWCDEDADADADSSVKQYVDPHPMGGGRHNK